VIAWVTLGTALAIHDAQIAEHGGLEGLRDRNALEAALSRPQNLLAFGDPKPDLAALAAAYAFGIAKNHAFIDGNKRTSLAITETFLNLNGKELITGDVELLEVWTDLAAGELSERKLAAWIRERLAR
jgi:death on curing protein